MIMSKDTEPIKFWIESSVDTFDTAQRLFKAKKYHHCLFFVHLAIEKILKGLHVYKNNKSAPLIHDLVRLAEKCKIKLTKREKIQLAEISTFNLSARYDDYKFKFYKKATKEYASKWLKTGEKLHSKFIEKIV